MKYYFHNRVKNAYYSPNDEAYTYWEKVHLYVLCSRFPDFERLPNIYISLNAVLNKFNQYNIFVCQPPSRFVCVLFFLICLKDPHFRHIYHLYHHIYNRRYRRVSINLHWARVVGFGPFSLCVIQREACAPAVRTIICWWWWWWWCSSKYNWITELRNPLDH
jgi:hypothetical protein